MSKFNSDTWYNIRYFYNLFFQPRGHSFRVHIFCSQIARSYFIYNIAFCSPLFLPNLAPIGRLSPARKTSSTAATVVLLAGPTPTWNRKTILCEYAIVKRHMVRIFYKFSIKKLRRGGAARWLTERRGFMKVTR